MAQGETCRNGGEMPLRGLFLLGRCHPHPEPQATTRLPGLFRVGWPEPYLKGQPLRPPIGLFPHPMQPFERGVLPLLPRHSLYLLGRNNLDQGVTEP
jgi:hypothetical protein